MLWYVNNDCIRMAKYLNYLNLFLDLFSTFEHRERERIIWIITDRTWMNHALTSMVPIDYGYHTPLNIAIIIMIINYPFKKSFPFSLSFFHSRPSCFFHHSIHQYCVEDIQQKKFPNKKRQQLNQKKFEDDNWEREREK